MIPVDAKKKSGQPKLVLLCPHYLGVDEGAPAGPELTGSYCRSLRPLTSGPSGPVLEQGFHFKRQGQRETHILWTIKKFGFLAGSEVIKEILLLPQTS